MKSKITMGIKAGIAVLAFHLSGLLLTEAFALVLMHTNLNEKWLKYLYTTGGSVITIFLAFPVFVIAMRVWGHLKPFHFKCAVKMSGRQHLLCVALSLLPMCILFGIEIYMLGNGTLQAADILNTEPFSLMDTVVFSCFLMPVTEEVMFRGILLHALLPYGQAYAILLTTIFFVSGHLNPVNMLLSIIHGLMFACVAVKMKGIQYGVFYHIGINLLGQLIIPVFIVLFLV